MALFSSNRTLYGRGEGSCERTASGGQMRTVLISAEARRSDGGFDMWISGEIRYVERYGCEYKR